MNTCKNILAVVVGTTSLTLLPAAIPINDTPKYSSTQVASYLGAVAEARIDFGFVNPRRNSRVRKTEGAGARGCQRLGNAYLALLAPDDRAGLTTSPRPTFTWYVENVASVPMQFTLVELGVSKPVLLKKFNLPKPGIIELEMPSNAPTLKLNKQYRWTVTLICNERRPSENVYARAAIQRVATNLDEQLKNANSDLLRAKVYADASILYDAMASAAKAYLANPREKASSEYFFQLLEQVGLSKVASKEQQRLASQ